MRQRLILALLAVALLWQALPLAGLASLLAGSRTDFAHEMLHWADVTHHHHADGTHHFDSSTDSVRHLIADHFNTTVSTSGASAQIVAQEPSVTPRWRDASGMPAPFLEGPLRPPRLPA